MKLWIDDVRQPPEGWVWSRNTHDAIGNIETFFIECPDNELHISLDHDAGDYEKYGGDYIRILEELESLSYWNENWRNYLRTKVFFHIHSQNPVGAENMRRIMRKNNWMEE